MDGNAGEMIARVGQGKRVALVGHFPFVTKLRQEVGRLDVLELNPRPGDRPASEAVDIIPRADVVALTSMTLVNGTLLELLTLCKPRAYVMLLGPSTPLSPILFDFGVDHLCGSIVDDVQSMLDGVSAGQSFRKIRRRGRVRLVNVLGN